ncbi:hypothetical protein GXW74_02570 [Roseomonas eburnea]|uniref:DUF3592 domain-containing protein n=1 Tax=Neoroseomonas eburnea TaxID=1346889 RepID=A0A9X9X6M1_9PROT|nr:DUF3592 domain-containing protein [Neoroseomonas eburnea]MBR0679357.1 hypothetical protein [Neoroseomonas eburnea]
MAVASGIVICSIGAVLLYRDLRSVLRRIFWRRTRAVAVTHKGLGGSRFDFCLPDGSAVSAPAVGSRNRGFPIGSMPVTIVYNPKAPSHGVEVVSGVGMVVSLAFTAVLLAVGVRELFN